MDLCRKTIWDTRNDSVQCAKTWKRKIIVLIVYVDDNVLSGDDITEIIELKRRWVISMLRCRHANTLIEFNYKLRNLGDKVPVEKEKYQCLVGKLIYLSHTRPDISYAVSNVSQLCRLPMRNTWRQFTVMRYLKTTPGKGLMFRKTDKRVLRPILILTGQSPLLTENPPPATVPLYEQSCNLE
ncbi:putative mitochondrial protein [Cucumis melo var. makuwa]|uniref:Mitochondrial protein n=1 Tax=Cucumis melo var. makuwa TaxID=1194695 RepID=A0A5A7UJ07_CUCMM|nr:putative mitochondrial protein [Cucumis melo var. makuwa]TYK20725.1 putative mitochondrial protein [Cucumis melo var. makuwa]